MLPPDADRPAATEPEVVEPLVSVGMPVFNGAATIVAAVQSALDQTHRNLEIIISDNASTDDTGEICRRLADRDQRIRYVRQPENLGAAPNFRAVLTEASGEYFMWLGADDRIEPMYVEANLAAIRADEGLIGSSSMVWWSSGDPAPGTFAIRGNRAARVATFLRYGRDNSRFYGVFEIGALKRGFPSLDLHGFDLAVMVSTLMEGGHGCVDQVLLVRERSDPVSYVQGSQPMAEGAWDRRFPLLPLTRYLLAEVRVPRTPGVLFWLLARNVYEAFRAVGVSHADSRVTRSMFRVIDWVRLRSVGRD